MPFSVESAPAQTGRIAVVTGANTGLGFESALAFARTGMHVVMACRTESRALDAIARIRAEVPDAALEFMQLDLSDLDNVRAFATAFKDKHDKLDVLMNNAGIMMPPFSTTKDGFESQMGANHFGHFLLTSLLLDVMPDTPASRVVTLSSNAHKMGKKRILFDDVNFAQDYSAMVAYCQSKLACLMFANALDRRLKAAGKSIVVVSAHPGASDTELSRFLPKAMMAFFGLFAPLMTHKPVHAALPQLQAALDDNVEGGDYFGPTGFREMKGPPGKVKQLPYALDVGHQDRLWALSEELTGADFALEPA